MGKAFWSRRALGQLRSQKAWLRARNPSAAGALRAEIARTVDLLAHEPGLGRRIEGTGLRVFLTRPHRFRVVYRATGEGVEIVSVLHPRQG